MQAYCFNNLNIMCTNNQVISNIGKTFKREIDPLGRCILMIMSNSVILIFLLLCNYV